MLNDDLAARGSLGKLGFNLSLLGVGNFLKLSIDVADFLLDFLVVLPSLFRGINSQTRSPGEFLLNRRFLLVEPALLLFKEFLGTGQGHQVVLLGLFRDGSHEFGLTLLGSSLFLGDFLLSSLFLSPLMGRVSLSDEKNFFVVATSFLPLVPHLLAPLGVGGRHLALDDADAPLSLGKLFAVLPLLNNADAVRVLAALLLQTCDLLCFSLVGSVKFVLNHLESDLDLGGLLSRKFQSLLHRWTDINGRSRDLNLKAHGHIARVLVLG